MLKPETRKRLEDRLIIKATQKIRRHLKPHEIAMFFVHNRGQIERAEQEFNELIDSIVNNYLEGLK